MKTLIEDIIVARTLTSGVCPDMAEIGAVATESAKKSTRYKAIQRIKRGRVTQREASNLSQWSGLNEFYLMCRDSVSEEGQYWEIVRLLTNKLRDVREVAAKLTE